MCVRVCVWVYVCVCVCVCVFACVRVCKLQHTYKYYDIKQVILCSKCYNGLKMLAYTHTHTHTYTHAHTHTHTHIYLPAHTKEKLNKMQCILTPNIPYPYSEELCMIIRPKFSSGSLIFTF